MFFSNLTTTQNFLCWNNKYIDFAFEYNKIYGAKVIKSNFGYAIAYEKELIMNEIHDFKDGFVRNVFNNVWDGRSYVKPADDDD